MEGAEGTVDEVRAVDWARGPAPGLRRIVGLAKTSDIETAGELLGP